MFTNTITGRVVWLNASQEAVIKHADRLITEWEAEKIAEQQKEDMYNLRKHLRQMEDRTRRYPLAEQMRAEARRKFLASCTPKHHAYEYTDFDFEFDSIKYHYSNGDIEQILDYQFLEEIAL